MRLIDILETTTSAEDHAEGLGLQDAGEGMWSDPQTGKITHRTDQGRLIKLNPDGASETNNLLRKIIKLSLIQILLGDNL